MRPTIAAWFELHGLPGALVPDYFVLVALSAMLGSAWALRQARRDGVDVGAEAWTLGIAYVGALLGGYLFEGLRVLPVALATLSLAPFGHIGRAAWGGLLFGAVAAFWHLRRRRQPIAPFFDRVVVAAGLAFVLVRVGCFLSGCDYGVPTALAIGVRFPSGSLAAMDHLARGWVPAGSRSLPVHPTELYESAVSLVGLLLALGLLRQRRHDGRAFLAWLAVYATGRLAIEFLRGDVSRGLYLGLSSAQYVSLATLFACAALWPRAGTRNRVEVLAARASGLGLGNGASS